MKEGEGRLAEPPLDTCMNTPMDFHSDKAAPGTLVEITKDQHDYMLNVLPPRYARGCFAMGEPVAHTDDGVTYHWAGERSGRYFICYGTRAQAERAFSSTI